MSLEVPSHSDRGRVLDVARVRGFTPAADARRQAITAELCAESQRRFGSDYLLWPRERQGVGLAELVTRILAEEHHLPLHEAEATANTLVSAGVDIWSNFLIGSGASYFNNANANLGSGDSSAAFTLSQTDLQSASNKVRKAMNATFPSLASHVLSFQATFATTDANWVWNEWAIFNANAAGTMLNRVVSNLGTKTSASAWTLTCTETLS